MQYRKDNRPSIAQFPGTLTPGKLSGTSGLTRAPMLTHLNFVTETSLMVDAPDITVGAVLLQYTRDHWRPV